MGTSDYPNTSHGFRLKGSNAVPQAILDSKNSMGLNSYLEYRSNDVRKMPQTAQGGKRSQRRQIITKNPGDSMQNKIDANKYLSDRDR